MKNDFLQNQWMNVLLNIFQHFETLNIFITFVCVSVQFLQMLYSNSSLITLYIESVRNLTQWNNCVCFYLFESYYIDVVPLLAIILET